ncbi:phospholipase D delta [Striga asiatica]|uniref:Phospholipase D delta n=1 Tax=Striga asiatica TaxID=4170 RepID=A0A5A7Q689_STRAF|nr:phospholipase D delta [Striga asiatica]
MKWRSRPTGVQSLPASPTGTDAPRPAFGDRRWSRLTRFQSPSRRRRRATHSIVSPNLRFLICAGQPQAEKTRRCSGRVQRRDRRYSVSSAATGMLMKKSDCGGGKSDEEVCR